MAQVPPDVQPSEPLSPSPPSAQSSSDTLAPVLALGLALGVTLLILPVILLAGYKKGKERGRDESKAIHRRSVPKMSAPPASNSTEVKFNPVYEVAIPACELQENPAYGFVQASSTGQRSGSES